MRVTFPWLLRWHLPCDSSQRSDPSFHTTRYRLWYSPPVSMLRANASLSPSASSGWTNFSHDSGSCSKDPGSRPTIRKISSDRYIVFRPKSHTQNPMPLTCWATCNRSSFSRNITPDRARSSASSRSAVASFSCSRNSCMSNCARCCASFRIVQLKMIDSSRNATRRNSSRKSPLANTKRGLINRKSTSTAPVMALDTPPTIPKYQALRMTVGNGKSKGRACKGTIEKVRPTARTAAPDPSRARADHGHLSMVVALENVLFMGAPRVYRGERRANNEYFLQDKGVFRQNRIISDRRRESFQRAPKIVTIRGPATTSSLPPSVKLRKIFLMARHITSAYGDIGYNAT